MYIRSVCISIAPVSEMMTDMTVARPPDFVNTRLESCDPYSSAWYHMCYYVYIKSLYIPYKIIIWYQNVTF